MGNKIILWDSFSKWIKSRENIILLFIIFIGAFLRFYDIGAESLWNDEVASLMESGMNISRMVEHSNMPPLYFLILRLWIKLFGISELALRSLSAIFGIISILFIYLIGNILFSKSVGLLAGFLSSVSWFHIYYSQDARSYPLLLLLSLVSYYFFIKIIKQNRKWHYVIYFLANILLGYTHLYGLLIITSQVLCFFLFWGKYRFQRVKFLSTIGANILAFIPMVYMLFNNVQKIIKNGFWIDEPFPRDILDTLLIFSGGEGPYRRYLLLTFLILIIIGFFSIRLIEGKWNWRKPLESAKVLTWKIKLESIEQEILLIIWLSVSIAVPYVLSKFITPIYVYHYIIGASPALYLLIAKGMGNLKRKLLLYIVLIFIIILSSFGLKSYYTDDIKEQWREVANLVETNSNNNDVIIFNCDFVQNNFDYYYDSKLPRFGFTAKGEETIKIDSFLDNTIQPKDRVWLILSHVQKGDKSLFKNYIIDKYGNKSIILEEQFKGVLVLLFETNPEGL